MSWSSFATRLEQHLQLRAPPVALCFSEAPPPGVARVSVREAAGCAYWRRAMAGEVFHTLPEDHHGCAVGAFTHGAELGPAERADLQSLVSTMIGLEYLSEEDVPRIPHRTAALRVLTYAPLAATPATPDVVLVRCTPRAAMLLGEAAHAVGARDPAPWGMRPACAIVPELTSQPRASASLGCIGNRVHTQLSDDELWCGISGPALEAVLQRLEVVTRANRELEAFHRGRAAAPA
jgi:uncharacterized protein (DUF169 family)